MAQNLNNTSEQLTPDAFLSLYRQLRNARRPMETAVAEYRGVRKKMKNAGVDLDALATLERLAKLDEDEAALKLRNLVRYAKWTDSKIGVGQGELFGGTDDQLPTDKSRAEFREGEVEDEGWSAGKSAQSIEANPYPPGSQHHVAWVKGWHLGHARAIEMLTPPAEPDGEGEADTPAPAPAPTSTRGTRRTRNAAAQAGGGNGPAF